VTHSEAFHTFGGRCVHFSIENVLDVFFDRIPMVLNLKGTERIVARFVFQVDISKKS